MVTLAILIIQDVLKQVREQQKLLFNLKITGFDSASARLYSNALVFGTKLRKVIYSSIFCAHTADDGYVLISWLNQYSAESSQILCAIYLTLST